MFEVLNGMKATSGQAYQTSHYTKFMQKNNLDTVAEPNIKMKKMFLFLKTPTYEIRTSSYNFVHVFFLRLLSELFSSLHIYEMVNAINRISLKSCVKSKKKRISIKE